MGEETICAIKKSQAHGSAKCAGITGSGGEWGQTRIRIKCLGQTVEYQYKLRYSIGENGKYSVFPRAPRRIAVFNRVKRLKGNAMLTREAPLLGDDLVVRGQLADQCPGLRLGLLKEPPVELRPRFRPLRS